MTMQKTPINPSLRPEFNSSAYEDRPAEEIAQWWNVPYIVTDTFEDQGDKTFDEYVARMRSYGNAPGRSREEWEADKAKHRENWFIWFPSGIRYEVRCLDGGDGIGQHPGVCLAHSPMPLNAHRVGQFILAIANLKICNLSRPTWPAKIDRLC